MRRAPHALPFGIRLFFVAAAKALGNAKKEYTPYDDLRLTSFV